MDEKIYKAAEAMREVAAELSERHADINRRNGYADLAELQVSIAQRIRRIDAGQVVDDSLNLPVASIDEIRAFEQEARRLFINDFRRNDKGFYSYGLTQRFWEMWRAGARFPAAGKK